MSKVWLRYALSALAALAIAGLAGVGPDFGPAAVAQDSQWGSSVLAGDSQWGVVTPRAVQGDFVATQDETGSL
ncbi:hypothetical protein [Streptomyces sp. NPDC003635]